MHGLIFRSASILKNMEKLNALNVLKTKRALCLWECTLAVHILELTDYALSLGYIYTVAREGLDMEIRIEGHGIKINIMKK